MLSVVLGCLVHIYWALTTCGVVPTLAGSHDCYPVPWCCSVVVLYITFEVVIPSCVMRWILVGSVLSSLIYYMHNWIEQWLQYLILPSYPLLRGSVLTIAPSNGKATSRPSPIERAQLKNAPRVTLGTANCTLDVV